MFLSATLLASFLGLFQGVQGNTQYSDELIAAMVKTAQENALLAPKLRAAPQVQGLRAESMDILKDKPSPTPKPKPDPKPKPGPYMVFSNHIDDPDCGTPSAIEAHGYLIGHCFTGVGGLSGLYWSFTASSDEDNIFLNYGFYVDDQCATPPVVSSVETLPNGCAARGNSGGHDRTKFFYITPRIPSYRAGVLFNGYQTEDECKKHKQDDVIDWSYLENNQCDPQIHSPVYGEHVVDETRTCRRKEISAVLYSTNDMTCSGDVTTTTKITREWDCAVGSNSGVDGVYLQPLCV